MAHPVRCVGGMSALPTLLTPRASRRELLSLNFFRQPTETAVFLWHGQHGYGGAEQRPHRRLPRTPDPGVHD